KQSQMSKKLKTAIVGAAIALLVGFAVSYGLISPQTGDQIKAKTDEILSEEETAQPAPDASAEQTSESTTEPSAEPAPAPSDEPAPAPSAEPSTEAAATPPADPASEASDSSPEEPVAEPEQEQTPSE